MELSAFSPGTLVGPYEIQRTLGKGGMGVVFRAQHRKTGELVALKTVKSANPQLLSSIRREIQRLRRLSHPGVVRIRDDGVHDSFPWYTMDLYECDTWEQMFEPRRTSSIPGGRYSPSKFAETAVMETQTPSTPSDPDQVVLVRDHLGPLDPDALPEVLRRTQRLCDVLSYIHGEGVVHRDLKPGNVFLPGADRTVLVDFGLVVAYFGSDGREVLQIAPSLAGTVAYMSPEQLRGDHIDARSDLFSLGCMLYETLTGRLPFPPAFQARLASMSQTPQPPSAFAPFVPTALDKLILKMLASDRRERIGHASDISAALSSSLFIGQMPDRPRPAHDYLYRAMLAGRDGVLAELLRHVEKLVEGRGELILLEGESGSGKTRLLTEFLRRAQMAGASVLTGECLPPGMVRPGEAALQSGPLSPLRPLLQTIGDFCRTEGEKTTRELLGPRLRLLATIEPSLLSLPGAEELPELQPLPIDAARQRMIGAMLETLTALAQRGRMVLILDDLQWADGLTMELLAHLGGEQLASLPLLVIGSYRAEERTTDLTALLKKPLVSSKTLGRLDDAAVGSMVADMLAVRTAPSELVQFVASQAAGNPFFVTEFLYTAVQEGLLRRNHRGEWALVAPPEDTAGADASWQTRLAAHGLTGTVHAIIERRVRRLPPQQVQLLSCASVLGREFDGELLRAMTGAEEAAHADVMNELLRQHFFEPAGDSRYRFCHDKLREVSYDALPIEERQRLHRLAAETMEARGPQETELLQLANHFTAAEVPPKALMYLSRASELLIRTGAHQQAAPLVSRAIAFAEMEAGTVDRAELAKLYLQKAETQFALGNMQEGALGAEQALRLLDVRLGSGPSLGVTNFLSQLVKQVGRVIGLRKPTATARAEEEAICAARAATQLSICYFAGGRSQIDVMTATLLAANLAEEAGPRGPRAVAYSTLGYAAGMMRLQSLALRYFADAQALAIAQGDPASQASAAIMECAHYNGNAEWDKMQVRYEAALATTYRSLDPLNRQALQLIAAGQALLTGKLGESDVLLKEVIRAARQCRAEANEGWACSLAAHHALWSGQLERAIELATEAIQHLVDDRGNAAANPFSVRAAASLFLGQSTQALTDAEAALVALARGPVMFQMWPACEFLPQVLLSLWEEARRQHADNESMLRRLSNTAVSKVQSLSFLFRIGQPMSLRAEAVRARVEGKNKRSIKLLDRAIESAEQRQMPMARLAALCERARSEPDSAARKVRAAEVAQQALALGCHYFAIQAQRLG